MPQFTLKSLSYSSRGDYVSNYAAVGKRYGHLPKVFVHKLHTPSRLACSRQTQNQVRFAHPAGQGG